MLQNQIRIDKHKADIEKRITELETKLREPSKYSQNLGHHQTSHQNDRRILVQREKYVEPKQVAALRQRELNMKENSQNILIRSDFKDHNNKNESIYDSYVQKQKIRGRSPENYRLKLNSSHITKSENKSQTKELYDIMTEILVNQKNLQRQIGLLRFEWNKQHINKNSIGSKTISFDKKKFSQEPGLQNEQFIEPEAFEIINKKENVENEIKQQSRYKFVGSARKSAQNKYKNYHQQADILAMHQQNQHNEQIDDKKLRQQRGLSKSKNIKSQKRGSGVQTKQKQAQAHQKLLSLIKSQKSRGQRCKVKQLNKNEIWKKVEQRIKSSQNEYRQSIHRNNRHEHEHLINTNELQKKLKDDIIARIYNQTNNYLYK